MPATFIDTKKCTRQTVNEASGQVAEVVNAKLCGAKNVLGMLRWLDRGETFDAGPLPNSHQLLYLMEGNGVIRLEGKEYQVGKGAGVYLGPSEGASLSHAGSDQLRVFHLIVPPPA
jgi:glyoxylate utilization-related uncharacterized protein